MNTPIAYYMPVYLAQKAAASENTELLDFCSLFNVVNVNACVIDRTNTIHTPFKTHSFYPVPEQTDKIKDFGTLCIERASEVLAENEQVYFMYSGGLDSTCMLIAFHHVLQQKGDYSQLIVSSTTDAQSENPDAWAQIVLPRYQVIGATDMLAKISLDDGRYIQGENADQLFGSDRVFIEKELLYQAYNKDNLHNFLSKRISRTVALERFQTEFEELSAKCPLPILWMRDFLWWVNFTCKWQSVALRTLSFTNVFESDKKISFEQVKKFETFYNTIPFQELAISGKLDRWGIEPTAYTYKKAAREFILEHTGWEYYAKAKLKVGSLYNVIRQRRYAADAIGFSGGYLFATQMLD